MRIKDLVQAALLVAIGFILHAVCPPLVLGMKPDFSLAMMFIILMVKHDLKLGFLVALATGIFTALTTGFPGGQVANIIDKLVTFFIVFAILGPVMSKFSNKIGVAIITLIGTLISGAVFLGTAALLFGLPGPFTALFYTIVIPASIINAITGVIIFSSIKIGSSVTENYI